MSGPEALLAFSVVGGTLWVLRPMAAAMAKRIAGEHRRTETDDGGERDAILGELQQLRQEVTELQERVDFTERLLAKQKDAGALPPGGRR